MDTPDSLAVIHKDLADEASWGLQSLYDTWAKNRRIEPFMIVWPSKTVFFEGQEVNDSIPVMLPDNLADREHFMRSTAKKTSAWAVMLCEQRAEAVVVIFESPVGTKSWHLPIARHGDTLVLEDPKEFVNVDHIGVLFQTIERR